MTLADRLRLKQRLAEILLGIVGEARQRDGTVKGHQLRMFVDCQMHRRDVAVTEKDFRIAMDQVVVNAIQDVHRAVTAANGKDCIDVLDRETSHEDRPDAPESKCGSHSFACPHSFPSSFAVRNT